ncbi:hypothetical protein [Streptomyces wuyuanensis]|uniref:Uncharacterized protein n=1 Tax=Streptomyces wuyuanensis TaxID=1196353 RepID=A0A1G9ZEJ0_9ACTN|nr:hypothetical protein [Streptomyces wuyuanensis]SDN19056.1 hypothetical protein SAMN05444921_12187 [Streptomyces wuyuanensis]
MSARDELRDCFLSDSRDRFEAAADAFRAEVLAEAIEAARSEYLEDNTGTPEDEAYNQGVTDAVAAIGALLASSSPSPAAGDKQPEADGPLDHTAVAASLRAKAGTWQRVKVVASQNTGRVLAGHIRRALSVGYMPAGSFDAEYRHEAGQHTVYARYVGEAGER